MPRPRQTPAVLDDHVSDSDPDDVEVDENIPVNDENAFTSSELLTLHTPHSHSRTSQDTALCDITDQFFHPPSPSPIRISKSKLPTTRSIEPPKRPKKPKSLAYPADPPNWLYSRPSSSLPPSSPFPPSTTIIDHAQFTDHSVGHPPTARREYHLGTPTRASDSDPFGFVAVERAIKARCCVPPLAPASPKLTSRTSAAKSPPRNSVLAPLTASLPTSSFASLSQFDAPAPMATNNEDIDDLYTDEPVAGPSRVQVVAPLLMMNSDQPLVDSGAAWSQPTFPDPLRTPHKRKRRASPTNDGTLYSGDEQSDIPSSPSPVKVSIAAGTQSYRRPGTVRSNQAPVLKLTRAQTKAAGTANPKSPTHTQQPSRRTRFAASYQNIPTPSSTRHSPSSRRSTAPPTPVPPRRSTRQAAVGARAKLKGATGDEEGEERVRRMTLRSKSTKTNVVNGRAKQSPSKAKVPTKDQKTTATKGKPARGRPRGKSDAKGKGKARSLENVLDLSDGTLERYDKERRERLEYFKRLEGYQIQKENVYVV